MKKLTQIQEDGLRGLKKEDLIELVQQKNHKLREYENDFRLNNQINQGLHARISEQEDKIIQMEDHANQVRTRAEGHAAEL